MNNSFCVMPKLGLAIQNNGDLCVCLSNKMSFKNNQHEVIFLDRHPLKESWNSYTRKMISSSIDKGVKLDSCRECHDYEAGNLISPRMQLNTLFKDTIPSTTQPKVLILKPGNNCNLACRTCNPETSTKWYRDGFKLEKDSGFEGSFDSYVKRFNHISNGFHPYNSDTWNTIVDWLPGLEFLDIYGGEPMLVPKLFESLNTATKTNTVDTSVQIHTNGTVFKREYLDILSRFKNVRFVISVDSDDEIENNYIRYPVDSSQVFGNIEKFKQYKNFEFNISLTVSPFNIFYVDRIVENLSDRFGMHVNVNAIVSPDEYDIRHLPEKVRLLISEKSNYFNDYILETIPGCDIYWPRFWQLTQKLDSIRNQDFKSTFPEFYQLIKEFV